MSRSATFAFDARPLAGGVSGDRTYQVNLLRELVDLAPDHDYRLCYNDASTTGVEHEPWAAHCRVDAIPQRPGWLWTPLAWPRHLRRERVDLALAQYLVPPLAPCPTVVTIHDVSFLAHPEWFPKRAVRIMRALIPLSARRATRIVTGSTHAAGEIARHCGVPRERILVAPYGVEPRFSPQDAGEARAVAEQYGLADPYVLAVGLIQPRKNLPRLIEAFARVAPDHPSLRLALVGRTGWGMDAVRERLAAAGVADRAVFCGAVPDEHLPALYAAAELLVYPSLYEGFGFPPLEALACGAPVVASGTTSIPEVVGEAALLVDPLSIDSIADAMARVLADDELRARLAAAGPAQAAPFTWRACAKRHLTLFESLVQPR